jgi:hypothetical protein
MANKQRASRDLSADVQVARRQKSRPGAPCPDGVRDICPLCIDRGFCVRPDNRLQAHTSASTRPLACQRTRKGVAGAPLGRGGGPVRESSVVLASRVSSSSTGPNLELELARAARETRFRRRARQAAASRQPALENGQNPFLIFIPRNNCLARSIGRPAISRRGRPQASAPLVCWPMPLV